MKFEILMETFVNSLLHSWLPSWICCWVFCLICEHFISGPDFYVGPCEISHFSFLMALFICLFVRSLLLKGSSQTILIFAVEAKAVVHIPKIRCRDSTRGM